MLNCDSEANLIKKHFVRKLNLKACALKDIDLITFNNKSLQTHEVYFLIIAIKDLTRMKHFFEKFFLTMNIDNDLIFNMSWFELINFNVNWINQQLNRWVDQIENKAEIFMSIIKRLKEMQSKLFVEKVLNHKIFVYVFYIRSEQNELCNVYSNW